MTLKESLDFIESFAHDNAAMFLQRDQNKLADCMKALRHIEKIRFEVLVLQNDLFHFRNAFFPDGERGPNENDPVPIEPPIQVSPDGPM